jgi:membrane-associated phospholipid phosphatase
VGRAVGGAVLTLLCGAGVVVLHSVFVLSARGQLVDDATLSGGRIGERYLRGYAEQVLDLVSVLGLVIAAAVVLLIGVLRRRVRRALLAVVIVGGPTITTQVLKRWVFERPDLVETGGAAANSLPSGHTTFAAGVAAAILVVLPPRLRPAGAALAALYTAVTGSATLAVGWHRASDVVAAVLVVGAWTGLVCAAISLRERRIGLRESSSGSSGFRVLVPGIAVVALLTGSAAAALAALTWSGPLPVEGRTQLFAAYSGSVMGITAVSCAVFLAAVLVLRPAPAAVPGPSDHDLHPPEDDDRPPPRGPEVPPVALRASPPAPGAGAG